jgi:hypothetical protein
MTRRRLLTIDPGLRGTGFVVWTRAGTPVRAGVLTPPRTYEFQARALWLAFEVQRIVAPTKRDLVICEFPEYQASAARAMGWQTGDLQKLTFLTGVFAGILYPGVFIPVTPSKWKGQLPKSVVEARVTKRLGRDTIRRLGIHTHAFDAAGIGLWAIDEGVWT